MKERMQVYLNERTQNKIERLCRANGWKPGHVIERLVAYLERTRKLAAFMDVVKDDVGEDALYVGDPVDDYAEVISVGEDILKVVIAVKEGLTPFAGFYNEEGEDNE